MCYRVVNKIIGRSLIRSSSCCFPGSIVTDRCAIRDAVKPCAEFRSATKAVKVLVGFHETVLRGLLGIFGIAQHAMAYGVHHVLVGAHHFRVRTAVTGENARKEARIHMYICDVNGWEAVTNLAIVEFPEYEIVKYGDPRTLSGK